MTSRADVNIAAVNYHFGSKENLVNEVFRRRMDDMSRARLSQLQSALEQTIRASWSRSWPRSSSPPWRWRRTATAAAPSSA